MLDSKKFGKVGVIARESETCFCCGLDDRFGNDLAVTADIGDPLAASEIKAHQNHDVQVAVGKTRHCT